MRDLHHRLLMQAEQCRLAGSPLTGALLDGAATDLRQGGIVAELLAAHAQEPSGSVPSLRLAGSLHRLVLERKAPELALHYPSVGGTAGIEGLWPAAERACREHADQLSALLCNGVQTNEVGRSAVLFGALGMIGGPVRLLEIGASAGLNLHCDRFGYDIAPGTVLGDPSSPVVLHRPWRGLPRPHQPFEVVDRRGCDPAPLDPGTTEGRLTLTSYVWADQIPRLERLRGALDVAARQPAPVDKAGAFDFLTRELADRLTGVTTVVWHSVVWQYVAAAERRAVDLLFSDVGSHATAQAPLVRVSLEPERVGQDYTFQVHIQQWPTGKRIHIADALGHGPPVHWNGARMSA